MSTQRTMPGGIANLAVMPRGEYGRRLCRWCQLEVPRGRRTFCSSFCVHEWRLRTDPGYLRDQVFARDKGKCALCLIDTVEAQRRLKRARGNSRKAMLQYWGLRALTRRSLWDADHVLPVCEGGGECDLDNIRTLCMACHREVTDALMRRRRTGSSTAEPLPA